ncbi:histidine kinase dimerization/phosphoacceptor domain -containing protein [Arenibaculum pallidiluteum]|uniref:histidine kinase dimerization/phosphoacceptor domain -containing protein n=1 Tax=Arenibaculum pallidiluteum TaxID=2812559 RepID=UPI0022A6ADA4|nr:sensor histidine kinase [Arenibaculum pallidiluteum]
MAQLDLRLALRQKSRLLEHQDLLLKEVNHRTKNSLQLIGSIITLQLGSVDDQLARAALLSTSSRIRSIAAVHERLYRGGRVDAVELGTLLQTLVAGLDPARRDVSLSVEVAPVATPPMSRCRWR